MLQRFDERNRDLIVNVNGRLLHRDEAGVSPFDSVVQGGDAVWEGLRLYDGRIFKLEEHLARLRSSAGALAFAEIPSDEKIIGEIRKTLAANRMRDGVHIRLTLTRGVKYTSGMDPRLNQSGPTLIVLAEHKAPVYDRAGLRLVTSSLRRFDPDALDPKIHHANLLQSILAKIEGQRSGGRRRAHARPARLRCGDQRHQLLHRDGWSGDDQPRRGLSRRDHARDRPRAVRGERHSVTGEGPLPDGSLPCRRGVLQRNHGRAGQRDRYRRSDHRGRSTRVDDGAPGRTVPGTDGPRGDGDLTPGLTQGR